MNDTLPAPLPVILLDEDDDSSEFVALTLLPEAKPRPGFFRRAWNGFGSASEWVFGAIALSVGLSLLAATPILQFLSFGYLLEAERRVAQSGRLRDGLVGFRLAARVGSMAIGGWLLLLPLRLMSSLAASAEVIDPRGPVARRWTIALIVLSVLIMTHIVTACARGGKLRYFFWPLNPIWMARRLRRGGFYAASRDAVWSFVASLRLPYYFRLGLLGFVGTLLWLALPVTMIAIGRNVPLIGFLGGLALGTVALSLPFLQVRFATENRFRAMFETRAVRDRFRRAPWAFALAFFLTLSFAVPLYLLKIEMIPREAVWLPSLVFITFIFPARLLTGWAYSRSERRETSRHWFFRATSKLWMLPTAALYVIIVFFTQFTAWKGIWSLYEQHAFLLPVPFLSL